MGTTTCTTVPEFRALSIVSRPSRSRTLCRMRLPSAVVMTLALISRGVILLSLRSLDVGDVGDDGDLTGHFSRFIPHVVPVAPDNRESRPHVGDCIIIRPTSGGPPCRTLVGAKISYGGDGRKFASVLKWLSPANCRLPLARSPRPLTAGPPRRIVETCLIDRHRREKAAGIAPPGV